MGCVSTTTLTADERVTGAREHAAHAVAQAGIDATVEITDQPTIRVTVADPIRRHALAGVVTDGRPVTREVFHDHEPIEVLTGWSRFYPAIPVSLVGPTARSAA